MVRDCLRSMSLQIKMIPMLIQDQKSFAKQVSQFFYYLLFEGYLCYKMITSQNLISEAQVKNFSIS